MEDLKMLIIPTSANVKTGNVIQSYSARCTCPNSCPLKNHGCYGDNYTLTTKWSRCENASDKRYVGNGEDLVKALMGAVTIHSMSENEVLFRHNVVGDMAVTDSAELDEKRVDIITKSCKKVKEFAKTIGARFVPYTYTHCPITERTADIIKKAHKDGFTINASCETIEEVQNALANGVPAVIASADPKATEEELNKVGIACELCRNQSVKKKQCKGCKLCTAYRKKVVIFAVHGVGAKKATAAIIEKNNQ